MITTPWLKLVLALGLVTSLHNSPRLSAQPPVKPRPTTEQVRWQVEGDGARLQLLTAESSPGTNDAADKIRFSLPAHGQLITTPQNEFTQLPATTAIRFRIRAPHAQPDQPCKLECRWYSRDRAAWRWRRLELHDNQWQQFELPLAWFRHSPRAHVDWNETTRLAFWSPSAETYELDRIELVQPDNNDDFDPLTHQLSRIAFTKQPRIETSDHFALITNVESLDHVAVLQMLETLHARIIDDFPQLKPPTHPIPLLVFANKTEYQAFIARLGSLLQAHIRPPTTPGFTVHSIACAVHSERFGPIRPVYVHEAAHALLAPMFGLSNQGEWLHEGLASHYQTTLLDQERRLLARSVAAEPVSWDRMLTGDRLEPTHYAHAMFFVEWLLSQPNRRDALTDWIRQTRSQPAAALVSITTLLGDDTEQLQNDYREFIQSLGDDSNVGTGSHGQSD